MAADHPTAPQKPRAPETALSPALLTRVFHQPALIYFSAAAQHQSIREAARRLNVASSAVTRQIAQLESALGVALFQREGRRIRLSPAGEILLRHAGQMTAPMEAAVAELELLRGIKTGILRIATVESIGLSYLPRLIADFGSRYPRLQIDVAVTSSADVTARLVDDRIDIGFSFFAVPPRQVQIALRRDVGIGAVLRPDHPLAQQDKVSIADCLAHPVAVATPEISIREVIDPFLHRAATVLPPFVEVNSIRMLVELALVGNYVSIMTPIGAHTQLDGGGLVFRPLSDRQLPTNRFGILVRNEASLSHAPAVFFERARRYFETLELPGGL